MYDTFCVGTGILFVSVCVLCVFARKYLNDNPGVKDTAKKAAATTAIGLLGKLIGK